MIAQSLAIHLQRHSSMAGIVKSGVANLNVSLEFACEVYRPARWQWVCSKMYKDKAASDIVQWIKKTLPTPKVSQLNQGVEMKEAT